MKIQIFLGTLVLGAVSTFSGLAWGQDAGAAAGAGGGGGRGALSFLSAEDRAHLMRVRQQVMAQNPDLKSEQDKMMAERKSAKSDGGDASTQDKGAMMKQMRDFHEKMDAAMIKDDPSVQPILEKVKDHMKERLQQRAAAGGAAASGGDSGNQ